MKQRAFSWLVLGFSAGIIAGRLARAEFLSLYLAAVVCLLLASRRGPGRGLLLFFLFFLLGATCFSNSRYLSRQHILRLFSRQKENLCILKGFIADYPQQGPTRISFVFQIEEARFAGKNFACCGKVLVYARQTEKVGYGDEVLLCGRPCRPFGSFKSYLANRGILLVIRLKNKSCLLRLKQNRAFSLKKAIYKFKDKSEAVLAKYVSVLTGAVLQAMVLGEKRNLPWFIREQMRKSGTLHILVVSGFNVGIVAASALLLLKLLRLGRRLRLLIAAAVVLLYCLLSGASTPVVRASLMSIAVLFSLWLKREADSYNSLSLAAFLILLFNPGQLFDAAFQLSFSSVFALVFLYPRLKLFFGLEQRKPGFVRFILQAAAVSSSAWIGTAGFIVYYFRLFAPVTVLANIFIVPLATLITLCGFSLVFFNLVFPFFCPFIASSAELAVALLVKFNFLLLKLPGAYFYLP